MRLMLVLIVTKKDYLVAYCRSKVFQLGVICGGRSWEGCYWHLVARCQEWNLASYKKLMSTATKVKKLCCKYMEYIYSIYIYVVFNLLLLFACHLLTFIFEQKLTQKLIQIHIPNDSQPELSCIFSENLMW